MNLGEYLKKLETLNSTPLAQSCLAVLEKKGDGRDPMNYHPSTLMTAGEDSVSPENRRSLPVESALNLAIASLTAPNPRTDYERALNLQARIERLLGSEMKLDPPEKWDSQEEAGAWLLAELASAMG